MGRGGRRRPRPGDSFAGTASISRNTVPSSSGREAESPRAERREARWGKRAPVACVACLTCVACVVSPAVSLLPPGRVRPRMEVSGGYKLKTGDRAPPFELPNVDGARMGLASFAGAKALVVAFWCNHCPYVRAHERRVIGLAERMRPRGVAFVAINSNDEANYPEDSFGHMVARHKEMGYTFPYLRDKDQVAARDYGAACTPQFLLFDRDLRLAYQGRFDDDPDPKGLATAALGGTPTAAPKGGPTERYLEDAIEAVLAGRKPPRETTWAIGCSIKWG